MDNTINNKINAARLLRLDILEEYKIVDGNKFAVLYIKKDDTIVETFLSPLDTKTALVQLEQQRENLRIALEDLEKKIEQIKALGE